MSSLPVSEGDVEASDFPLKAAGRARLLVKVRSLEELHPFFLIVNSLPRFAEEDRWGCRGGADGAQLSPLTKRERSLPLVDKEM